MNAVIVITVILLRCLSHCIHVDHCSSFDVSPCSKYLSCKCSSLKENQDLNCKLICRNLSNSVDLSFDHRKNNSNTNFIDVEITLSHISEINATHTKSFGMVKMLNLSYNKLTTIASDTFYNLAKLKSLDLSHNCLSAIQNDLLIKLTNLEYLNLADNQIQKISASCLKGLKKLYSLNLSRNNLTEIPEDLLFNMPELKMLSLAHNKLSVLPDKIFCNLTELQILDLSNNQLTGLQPPLFQSLKNLHNLSFSYNQIETLEEKTFAQLNKRHTYIDLRGNPWNCSTRIYWLYFWLLENSYTESLENLYCYSSEDSTNRTFTLNFELLLMSRSISELDVCKTCNCIVQLEWLIVVVNCTDKNLTSIPQKFPYRTRKVILDNNEIESFVIDEENIRNWTSVSFLGLNNNLISSLQTLEELSLLKNLMELNITGNKLKDIPVHLLDQLSDSGSELRLANNPWLCDCNALRFHTWLQVHYRRIKDVENIRCVSDNTYTSNKVIYKMMKSELCPQPPKPLDYLDVLNVTMGVLILLIISKVTYDYWHQKKTGKLPKFFGINLP